VPVARLRPLTTWQNEPMVEAWEFRIKTGGQGDMQDVTPWIAKRLAESPISAGLATVSVVGSTAAITTIECEPGLCEDFPRVLERLVPSDDIYRHELTWKDDNGHSHIQAALIGPCLTVPVVNGRLCLGTWQQIVLIELDTRSRERHVAVVLMGE